MGYARGSQRLRKVSLAEYPLGSQILCEYLTSMFLVMAAISPIILLNRVFDSGMAVAVLADGITVGFVLFALIEMFAPISGAHFNPAVSFAMTMHMHLTIKLIISSHGIVTILQMLIRNRI